MQNNAGVARDLSDLLNRLNDADLVVGMHNADELRVGLQRPPDFAGIDDAATVDRYFRYGTQLATGHQNRRMLNGGGDRVGVARDAEQRQIVGLGAAAGKYDFF